MPEGQLDPWISRIECVFHSFAAPTSGVTCLSIIEIDLSLAQLGLKVLTREEETETGIPFLDALVSRDGNKLRTSVYCKPTHTDRYIHFSSHHHPRILRGVIQCLRDRACNICDDSSRRKEITHLKKVFLANGYPEPMTSRTLNHQGHSPPVLAETTENEKKKILYLLYIKGVSEKIELLCAPLGVKTVFKSRHTLRQSLMRVKSPRQDDLKAGVVYEVPCADCNHVYIGETGRCLQKRVKEQIRSEDAGHKEWHSCTCMEERSQSRLGRCKGQSV